MNLSDENRGFVNQAFIAKLKKGCQLSSIPRAVAW